MGRFEGREKVGKYGNQYGNKEQKKTGNRAGWQKARLWKKKRDCLSQVDRPGKRGFDIWARLGTAGLGEMIMQAHWETGRPVTPGLVDRPGESTTCPWKVSLDRFHAPKNLLLQPTGAVLAKMGALGSGRGAGTKEPETLKKRGCRRRRKVCLYARLGIAKN